MSDLSFKIEGLDKLRSALKKAPVETLNEIGVAVNKSAVIITSQAIKEAPVNKQSGGGNLRQNIKPAFLSKTRAEVISHAPYSGYVEGGTRPHTIEYTKEGRGGLYNKRTGQGFGRKVNHPGTRANPFMQSAI